VRPLGAKHGFHVDVRLLCASNLPMDALVTSGHFGKELLEKVGHTTIKLPPLRERIGDIPGLARHFLTRIGEQPGLRPLTISDAALSLLSAYDWPGNVRQLQAVLFRSAVFCDNQTLTPQSFPQLCEPLAITVAA